MGSFKLTEEQAVCITKVQTVIHASCVAAGWYTDLETGKRLNRNIPEMIALAHSELSEALEGYRKNLMDDHLPNRKMIEVEFADTLIRILDTCGYLDLDVGAAMREKFAYNQQRADHKLENRQKENGKKI